MNGLLLQLLVLVMLLLTEPHQSAPSTMVISTVCVWSGLNLWETCVWCAMCELCVWWVWELTIHFFPHQHSPPEVTKGQGSKVNHTLCFTTLMFPWLYAVWRWSSLAFSSNLCYVQTRQRWSSVIHTVLVKFSVLSWALLVNWLGCVEVWLLLWQGSPTTVFTGYSSITTIVYCVCPKYIMYVLGPIPVQPPPVHSQAMVNCTQVYALLCMHVRRALHTWV